MSAFESLFDLPRAEPLVMRPARDGNYSLRDYQIEDVEAVLSAIAAGKRAIIARAATGLGKSVFISDLARILMRSRRVLVTVDVGSLARDLFESIAYHIGEPPGILTGEKKERLGSRVIVSTVQTLYAKCKETGLTRYTRAFDASEPWALLVDECEGSIADEFKGVCRFILEGNPENVMIGTTATPTRGDGRGLGELYDHANDQPGPLNRDILWAVDNGWLVKPKQAFVRVNVDFSSLKIRKTADGEKDYTDEALASLLQEETPMRELAMGMHRVAEGAPSIAICPTVEIAKLLAYHLSAFQPDSAHAVYGELGAYGQKLIADFKRGSYPYITSVNMLYKGFDADIVRYVFMARKTQSRRLYEQSLGRGTRPLKGVREALAAAPDAAARRAILAASDKPHMTIVDLVGLNDSAKDLGVIDILGESLPAETRARAKKQMQQADGEQDAQEVGREVANQIDEEKRRKEAAERRKRSMIQVDGQVEIEVTDDLSKPLHSRLKDTRRGGIPDRMRATLTKGGVSDAEIARMDIAAASKVHKLIIHRWKNNLCSWKQAKMLARHGFTKQQLHNMSRGEARANIERIKGGRP